MKTLLFALAALVASAIPASAITVASPADGAQVTSPFTLVASTSTCNAVPAVSMGYSLDHGSAIIEPNSFTAQIVASPGPHVLHVKCWGKQANSEVVMNVTVVGAKSDITVASPASGATITSPFTVVASATTCASTPAAALGYSIDGSKMVIQSASFSAQVSANPGQHVLTVKCTGASVSDQVSLNIHVVNPPAAATPRFSLVAGKYTTQQVVGLSDATPGATIYYTVDGSGPTTGSLVYAGPLTISSSITLQAIAVASGYSKSGLARADYVMTQATGPTIPSNANKSSQVQLMPNWRIKHDPATPGDSTGAMSVVSDPSQSGQANQYYTVYTNGGGELYSLTYGNDSNSQNFVYDAQVWIDEGSQLSNLEMDNNQVMPNGDTVIYAFQCSGNTNTWEYSSNSGTPKKPIVTWLRSTVPCNPSNWTPNTWHHVQISYSRDDAGNVTYHSVWLDGVEGVINQTVNSDFSLGWASGALVTNFQVDGMARTNSTATLYLDELTIYRW